MRRNWTPSIVPNGHDQTFYLVCLSEIKLAHTDEEVRQEMA